MLYHYLNRRCFVAVSALTGAGSILRNDFAATKSVLQESLSNQSDEPKERQMEMEVTAIEDLMREHGVLRRILIVYSESANRLRRARADIYEPISQAAELFRTFGENYHEKALEETFIFPVVSKLGNETSQYPSILIAQHQRGRQITDYILNAAKTKEPGDVQQLASAMDSLVRMYRPHAAREDTVVFPAWKQTLTKEQLDEMSEKFEDIEHDQFGKDGFDKAVSQIAAIEQQLGLADLSQFTAPPIVS